MTDMREVNPGDNHLAVNCIVNLVPLIRGIRAAIHFADKKDESGSYNGVRLMPFGDRMIISAANPMSMFATSAQLYAEPAAEAGVIDLPIWMAQQVVTLYGGYTDPEAIVWVRATESLVGFRDQSGLFPSDMHQWDRHHLKETAPDVPAALSKIFSQPRWEPEHTVLTASESHRVLQVQKIFATPVALDCSHTHARYRIGVSGKAAVVLPSEMRQDPIDFEETTRDSDETTTGDSDEAAEDGCKTIRAVSIVKANPTGGVV